MDVIEKEIEKARQANCFLGALVLALTLPSVCSYHEYKDKRVVPEERKRYPNWYNRYVYEFTSILDGRECYALRCALLHNGNDLLLNQKILNKDLEKYGDNEYHLHIPYSGDDYVLNYTVGENKIERPFCAAALILQILKGYEEFKKDYPDFKYPLEYR